MSLPFANYVKAHHISRAALCVGTLVAAIVFFVLGAGIRLLVGPVSLGPLQSTLAGAIQGALPGINLTYDTAAIEWSRDEGRINLVVLGARVLEDGRVVAQAPKADIDLAAAPFLKGEFVVKRITLVGVQLNLVHMKDGGLRLGREGDKPNDLLARINDLLKANGSTTTSLQSFAVRNANIAVFDEITGLDVIAPRASLALTARKGGALGAAFDADVTLAGQSAPRPVPAHVKVDLNLPSGKGPFTGDATITRLDLRNLGAQAPMFASLRNIALLVDLSTRFTVAEGGHITRTDFDLTADGEMPFHALTSKALHVRNISLTGSYDGIGNHITVNEAAIDAKEALLKLKGGGDLHYDAQGGLQDFSGQLESGRIALDMPGVFLQPVDFQSFAFKGSWQAAPRRIAIEKFALLGPSFNLDVKGNVGLGQAGQSPGLEINGVLKAMPVRTLMRYWPLQAAPGARTWINANIFAGALGPLVFETHFTPGMMDLAVLPEEAMKLSFGISDVEGNYISGLTHLTGVSGTATMLGDSFSADFDGGRIGAITVKSGHAVIPALHLNGTVGVFTAHAEGTMGDIMRLIDMKPLNYPTRFGIDPNQTKGQGAVDMEFHVPMLADLPVDDVGISVKAAVNDFAITLGQSTRLTNGTVNFIIDNDHLGATGMLTLADSRLTMDWLEDFKTTAPITTRINVKTQLTDAARATLNIGLATILTGPIGVNADIQGHRGALRVIDANVDLAPAQIAIPIINLGKATGVAAGGHITVNFGANDTVHDEVIRLTGPNLTANGTAQFDANGGLTVLNLPSVKMGALNDLSVTLVRTASGDDYTLRGRSLDGSMVGRNGTTTQGGSDAPPTAQADPMSGPFHISAHLDRLGMRDGVAIAPFNMELSGIGIRPGALTLSGGLSKTAQLSAAIEAVPTGRKLTINAGDAGLLLRGLFAFESMRGGKLRLATTLPGRAVDADVVGAAADFTGTLDIDDFTMLHQALLTRLFSAGSLTGMGDLMGGDGISIENLNVPFSSKNNVISVMNARATGRAICASSDGYLDRPRGTLALKGSLVPACGVNSVLSNIPLLGDLLASKKGEGVLSATYSATGNMEQPTISTNPFSMLAPGILRRIFEGHVPTGKDAPSNAPPTAQSNAAGPAANPAAN